MMLMTFGRGRANNQTTQSASAGAWSIQTREWAWDADSAWHGSLACQSLATGNHVRCGQRPIFSVV